MEKATRAPLTQKARHAARRQQLFQKQIDVAEAQGLVARDARRIM